MTIKIIGRWENGKPAVCHACLELRKLTRLALDELNQAGINIEECANEEEYNSYGIVATPLLIINGKIKLSGRVPPKEMLKELLRYELGKGDVK